MIWVDLTEFCKTKSRYKTQVWLIRVLEIGSGMGVRSNSGQWDLSLELKRDPWIYLLSPVSSYVGETINFSDSLVTWAIAF